MSRSFYISGGLSVLLALSCTNKKEPSSLENPPLAENISRAPEPDPEQPLVRGTWALPIDASAGASPGGKVERRDHEIRVSLAVENFEKPGFDRYGYWDQSGSYEHTYGGDRSGSFTYRFIGTEYLPTVLEVKARLSAESQTQGKPNETSDVTLLINGVALGKQTVAPDNGVGHFYVWRLTDPDQIRKLKIAPDASNELRFVVSQNAKHQNGLCIYGNALDASAPESGEPITVIYRLASKETSDVGQQRKSR